MLPGPDSHGLPRDLAELIARRFAILGEPTRILLLDMLSQRGEASVGELAHALDAGHANVSKHLSLLHAERILGRERVGTSVRYRIVDEQVLELCDAVCGSIRDQLRELSSLVQPVSRTRSWSRGSGQANTETTSKEEMSR